MHKAKTDQVTTKQPTTSVGWTVDLLVQAPVEDTHGKNTIEAAGDKVAEAVHFVSDQNSQPDTDKTGDDAKWGTVPPYQTPLPANTDGRYFCSSRVLPIWAA